MISYFEALELIIGECAVVGEELLPLAAAAGAVTARTIHARLDVPGFANAAMDGYAVAARDTARAGPDSPARLPVTDSVPAGTPAGAVNRRQAVEIMTGAPLPAGLDAVVARERVRTCPPSGTQPTSIEVTEPVLPGRNVRQAGEDFRRGSHLVPPGIRLGPHHLMALAACGLDQVPVRRALHAAVLTTGTELESAGSVLAPAHIRDANGPYLDALLALLGLAAAGRLSAGDEQAELENAIAGLDGKCDVLLTTGGVSAGRLDLVPGAIRAVGGRVLFHKVAIRPGKPLLYARLPGGTHVFALPGNPLAVAVGMRFFVIPAVHAMLGMAREQFAPAHCREPVARRGELRFFAKAHRSISADGRHEVALLPGQESFRIGPLLEANCWAIVPEGSTELSTGSTLLTAPLYP